jgi:hypothetical protein
MLHRNENFCLLLFTRKFSDLLGIAVAKGLVIKTIGDISPSKFDDFSLQALAHLERHQATSPTRAAGQRRNRLRRQKTLQ